VVISKSRSVKTLNESGNKRPTVAHSARAYIVIIIIISFLTAKLLIQTEQNPHHSLLWMRLSAGLTLCAHSVQLPS
jgi:hypothetical protein